MTINGGTVNLTASTTNGAYPLLNGVLFYDRGNSEVKIVGSPTSAYGGALYFPKAEVKWGGNSASKMNCTEVIGLTLTLQGNNETNIVTSGCPIGIIPRTQQVWLTS